MQRVRDILFLLLCLSILWSGAALAQTPTPTGPTAAPDLLWWQITQGNVSYSVIFLVGLLTFLLTRLFGPALDAIGNAFVLWARGWGKRGNFRQRYLSYVISQSRYLSLLPANVVTARWKYRRTEAALEELFTPVEIGPVRERGLGEREEQAIFREASPKGRQRGAPRNRIEALWWRVTDWLRGQWQRIRPPLQPSAAAIGELIQNTPRLVVRGDPGSGKTTVLRYLALTCARSLRQDSKEGDHRKMALRRFGWKRTPFPILVPLNLLSDVAQWPENRPLLDEIVATLSPDLHQHYPAGFLENQLRRGNCLVLFDGFDELGSPTARGKMARLIGAMADAYKHPKNRFLVSTRIVGYEGQLNGHGFQVHNVKELDNEAVRELVTKRYRTVALSEGLGRGEKEQKELQSQYAARSEGLLTDLRRNEGLRALTVNPLLLSLITLVHMVQVVLPDQRHLLYRDCVEILTERWQLRKRAEAGMETAREADELSLDQKITLLQEIALTMQERRDENGSQAVIARDDVRGLIAARLPDFIAAFLPDKPAARSQECQRRADALLNNIREESGILIEKGLDTAGEPVIGFSHLTFQEYLAADGLREHPDQRPIFYPNLFNPAWREVLLLYVAMVDAGDVIQRALTDASQIDLRRYLLAGRCLSEKVTIDPDLRTQVLTGLRGWLRPEEGTDAVTGIDDLLAHFGDDGLYEWLLDSLPDLLTAQERAGLAGPDGPDGANATHPHIRLQGTLLRLLGSDAATADRYAAGCVLSAIGDPRNLDEMISIPPGEFLMGSAEGEGYSEERPQHRLVLDAFSIARYPVTNGQYARFVAETDHRPPAHWQGNAPSAWLLNHPVVAVSWHDALAYCRWRSQTDGRPYRLPSEAEWEMAARGTDGRIYPWGNDFDPSRLNSSEGRGDWTTTPVGMYLEGASPFGCQDMAGNVWEWTQSAWRNDKEKTEFGYPYDPADGREKIDNPNNWGRVLRGGSFNNNHHNTRCAYRNGDDPGSRDTYNGFRLLSPGS